MRTDLPELRFVRPQSYASELDGDVAQRWNDALRPAASADGVVIDIFDAIGYDPWSGGVTAKDISLALKGAGDVVVNINSPGGDFFEGLAIYNLLRAHPGSVTVNVLGMAASAASLIAMAGNTVRIAESGYIMIHNVWGVVAGNQFDLLDMVEQFKAFDATIVSIYAKITGLPDANLADMMRATTWLAGPDAVEQGFADELMPADAAVEDAGVKEQRRSMNALRTADRMLAQHGGMPRSERRDLLNAIRRGTHDAAQGPATQDAGLCALVAAINDCSRTLSK